MPDKLTDSEIVKDLNDCKDISCNDCILCNDLCEIYHGGVPTFIIDLINRLQAERDAWKETAETSEKAYEEWHRVAELNAMKIIELQAENEVLEARIGVYETCNARKDEAIRGLEAENERLKEPASASSIHILVENAVESENRLPKFIQEIKSKAYKEFAERLKEYATQGFWEENAYVDTDQIDNLLKELVGEDNAKEKE